MSSERLKHVVVPRRRAPRTRRMSAPKIDLSWVRAHARQLGNHLASGRIRHRERLPGVGVDPLSIDVCLPTKELRCDCGHSATIIEVVNESRSHTGRTLDQPGRLPAGWTVPEPEQ